jgi:hypothetical protein
MTETQPAPAIISPTPGRVVWYTPTASEGLARIGDAPLAAIVTGVWSDTCVNLAVFDANGNSHSRTSVLLLQEGNPRPGGGYFAEWMPYQIGQAKKNAA